MFNHFSFRDRVALSGVNSINWARILAQIVYYFVAGAALGAPHRKISFTVPTGNFGDIFAGYAAMQMGLQSRSWWWRPMSTTSWRGHSRPGVMKKRGVTPTISPSMDIQVSSNFERLLAEVCGRDGAAVRRMMNQLSQSGSFEIEEGPLRAMRAVFGAGRCNEDETASTIAELWNEAGYLLDPHTAIGVHVAKDHDNGETPMVVLARRIRPNSGCGGKGFRKRPELPENLKDMMSAEERQQVLAADQAWWSDTSKITPGPLLLGCEHMKVQTTILDNGMTVVTDQMPHLKTAALGVWVRTGPARRMCIRTG